MDNDASQSLKRLEIFPNSRDSKSCALFCPVAYPLISIRIILKDCLTPLTCLQSIDHVMGVATKGWHQYGGGYGHNWRITLIQFGTQKLFWSSDCSSFVCLIPWFHLIPIAVGCIGHIAVNIPFPFSLVPRPSRSHANICALLFLITLIGRKVWSIWWCNADVTWTWFGGMSGMWTILHFLAVSSTIRGIESK